MSCSHCHDNVPHLRPKAMALTNHKVTMSQSNSLLLVSSIFLSNKKLTKTTDYRKLGGLELLLGQWRAVDTYSLKSE